jgi:hypothetical protein
VPRLQALRGNHDRVQPHDVSCPVLWKFINEANQLLDHLVAAAVQSFAMNAPLSGSIVDVLSGTRSAFWNEHKKLQVVKVEETLGMLQENSSADTNAATPGSDNMEAACAMSAHILCRNICGAANSAISRFVPDVDSVAFERLETFSCGL